MRKEFFYKVSGCFFVVDDFDSYIEFEVFRVGRFDFCVGIFVKIDVYDVIFFF